SAHHAKCHSQYRISQGPCWEAADRQRRDRGRSRARQEPVANFPQNELGVWTVGDMRLTSSVVRAIVPALVLSLAACQSPNSGSGSGGNGGTGTGGAQTGG